MQKNSYTLQNKKDKGKSLRTEQEIWLPVASGLALLILWLLLAMLVGIPHILPSPIDMILRLWELKKVLFLTHLPVTLLAVLLGFAASVLIGVLLAVMMDLSESLEAMLYPVMVLTQTIPVMCIAPLFVLWFGYTMQTRLLAIILSTFFTIAVNTMDGLKRTNQEVVQLMQTYGASSWEIFWHIKVPSALPDFMTSLKITFPWAVVGAAVAEWLGSQEGLGYYSKLMITRMDGPAVFATVLVLSLIAVLGMNLIKWADRRFVFWR